MVWYSPIHRVRSIEVLLLQWMDGLYFDNRYQFFEVFAGEGRVSAKWYHGMHPIRYVQNNHMLDNPKRFAEVSHVS